jgi:hypothetical protein
MTTPATPTRIVTCPGMSATARRCSSTARRDLADDDVGLSVYAAAAFRFCQARDTTPPVPARVVLET